MPAHIYIYICRYRNRYIHRIALGIAIGSSVGEDKTGSLGWDPGVPNLPWGPLGSICHESKVKACVVFLSLDEPVEHGAFSFDA